MSKKGGSTQAPPPPVMPPMPDNSAMIEQMMGMMGMMMQNMPQAPALPATPEVRRAPEQNWKERQDQLLAKSRADYTNDQKKKTGRTDTIHTSPLLDESDTNTTSKSLLNGA